MTLNTRPDGKYHSQAKEAFTELVTFPREKKSFNSRQKEKR
jgi:hypothetical protein